MGESLCCLCGLRRAHQTSSEHLSHVGRFQSVVATQCSAIRWLKTSIGLRQPSVFRGLPFSSAATLSSSSWVCKDRSVPFGKYCRSSPLVFSLVPRCHGEWLGGPRGEVPVYGRSFSAWPPSELGRPQARCPWLGSFSYGPPPNHADSRVGLRRGASGAGPVPTAPLRVK
jgi:hypothetical protein